MGQHTLVCHIQYRILADRAAITAPLGPDPAAQGAQRHPRLASGLLAGMTLVNHQPRRVLFEFQGERRLLGFACFTHLSHLLWRSQPAYGSVRDD